ncbi:uncharacterized protein LOC126881649 [Diabrotica virgifera virgifera]|uniref:HTH psq-type domain-containing protein n=1 Tax=Diabrotica virgifera virgifera TaxID=50390 RepID=A0ABM5JVL2_DIAVI|nr:uncharacterized protein LOC126881649 [Diabrotica virgifera virgifera]
MRTYKRKSEKGKTPYDIMKRAVKVVLEENFSVRKAAKNFEIPRKTLEKYCKKFMAVQEQNGNLINIQIGYAKSRQVFSTEQEELPRNPPKYKIKICLYWMSL